MQALGSTPERLNRFELILVAVCLLLSCFWLSSPASADSPADASDSTGLSTESPQTESPQTEPPQTEPPQTERPQTKRAWVPASGLPLETVDLDSLERGQKGYGLSVFSGTEPERFEVEVLGVWRNSKPELNYLLARLSGQDLEHSGVLAGMSGSPVFIEEKLVGAVAFSFSFGKDPIAGITPIQSMREIAGSVGGLGLESFGIRPMAPAAASAQTPTAARPAVWVPSLREVAEQGLDPEILERHIRVLMPGAGARSDAGPQSSLLWTASGFTGSSRRLLESGLGGALAPAAGLPTAGFGGGETTFNMEVVPASLTGGDAVSLLLVGGDLTLAAHGTVTDQHGDAILAFGHPIYSLGPIRLPMAESEVITSISSVQSSFKLSNAGRLIGVFDQDREAGAHGILGAEPSLVPVSVRVKGLADSRFQMYVADSPMFKSTLITMSALGALNAVSHTSGFQGIDVRARFSIKGQDDLEVRQSFDGNQAAIDGALFLLSYAAFLELNDLENAPITAVDVEMEQALEPRVEILERVTANRQRVKPGDRVQLTLELRPYRGERVRRKMSLTVPENTPDGRYYLMVGDGSSVDAARLMVEPAQAETLEESLDLLRTFHSRRDLRVLGLVAAKGLTVGGHVLPELPASMRSVLATGKNVSPMQLRVAGAWTEPLDTPIEGIHRVDLTVER